MPCFSFTTPRLRTVRSCTRLPLHFCRQKVKVASLFFYFFRCFFETKEKKNASQPSSLDFVLRVHRYFKPTRLQARGWRGKVFVVCSRVCARTCRASFFAAYKHSTKLKSENSHHDFPPTQQAPGRHARSLRYLPTRAVRCGLEKKYEYGTVRVWWRRGRGKTAEKTALMEKVWNRNGQKE